jgi:hypothetical protein
MAEEVKIDITASSTALEDTVKRSIAMIERFTSSVGGLSSKTVEGAAASVEAYKEMAASIKSIISLGETLTKQEKKLNDQRNKALTDAQKAQQKSADDRAAAEKRVTDRTKQLLDQVSRHQKSFYDNERRMAIENAKEFERLEEHKRQVRLAMRKDESLNLIAGGVGGGLPPTIGSAASASSGGFFGNLGGALSIFSQIGNVVTGIYSTVRMIHMAWREMKWAVEEVMKPLKQGLQYLDLIENTRFGLAGLLLTMTDLYKGQQKLTEDSERWNASLAISDRLIEKLQDASLKTKAVFSELARGMQEGFGPMLQAGVTENQVTPFVTRFVQSMSALKIPLREIGQEMRAFFNLESNPRTARLSFAVIGMAAKQMGISFEDAKKKLKELKEQGGLDEWFMENTRGLGVAGQAVMTTLSGIVSNVKELLERSLGEGTKDLYASLKETINSLLDVFVKFDAQGKATFNSELIGTIHLLASAFDSATSSLAKLVEITFKEHDGLLAIAKEWTIGVKMTVSAITDAIPDWLITYMKFITYGPEKFLTKAFKASVNSPIARGIANTVVNTLSASVYTPAPPEAGTQTNLDAVRKMGFSSMAAWKNYMDILSKYTNETGPHNPFFGPPVPNDFSYDPNAGQTPEDKEATKAADRERKQRQRENEQATKASLESAKRAAREFEDAQNNLIKATGNPIFADYRKEILGINRAYEDAVDKEKEYAKTLNWTDKQLQDRIDLYDQIKSIALSSAESDLVHNFIAYGQAQGKSFVNFANQQLKEEDAANKAQYGPQRRAVDKLIQEGMNAEVAPKFAREFAKELGKTLKENAREFANAFTFPMRDAISSFAKEGGRGFVAAMANEWNNLINAGAATFTEVIKTALGAQGTYTNVNGVLMRDGQAIGKEEYEKGKRRQTQVSNGMALASIAIGSYSQGRTGQAGSITGGILGGALAGAATGQWYMAVAGAIVGGITAAIGKQQSRSEYQYGIPMIDKGGRVSISDPRNLNAAEMQEMVGKMQEVVDHFWTSMVRLALKVQADIPTFQAINGKFQDNPSAFFMKHWQEFEDRTLPQTLMAPFFNSLSESFQRLGMGANRFKSIWEKYRDVDPNKIADILNVIADALINFHKVQDMFSPDWFNKTVLSEGENMNKSYADQFSEADDEIKRMANALTEIPQDTEEYFQMNKELSDLLVTRMEQMKELARQIAQFSRDSERSFAALRREMTVEGMGKIETDAEGNRTFTPDYEAQMEYYRKYLQTILDNISKATNLDELQYWQGEFFNTTGAMRGVANQMGPDASAALRDWLMGADGNSGVLGLFQSTISATTGRWGKEITDRNNDLFNAIKPALDRFTTDLGTSTDNINSVSNAFETLPPRIKDVVDGLKNFADTLNNMPSGGGGLIDAPDSKSDNAFVTTVLMKRLIG